ncbi:MAG: hypothetical protein J6I84_04040 [Bacilli bacterium]|nr:hypothetical protein [Bacilli bacterium]
MVTIGDAQNGKRKIENVDNPKNFPHTKAYNKYYGGIMSTGFVVIVVGIQLINAALDFFFTEKGKKNDRRQRDDRRR